MLGGKCLVLSFQVMMYDIFSPAQLAIVFSISATHLVMTLERVGLISKKK